MKIEQLFECHQINQEKRVSMAILIFQGHATH